ncbi:MAG: OmpA family protein [Cytophagales bacterium]
MKNTVQDLFLKFSFLLLLIIFANKTNAQKVVWANKLFEFTDNFQFENNFAELVLGAPTIYPETGLDAKHDPYSEGYILNYAKTNKKNTLTVGFAAPTIANQIVIGGIFNVGTIEAIYIIQKDNKEKIVYKLDKPESKPKFRSFATFIPSTTVYGVKIVLNHSKVNEWNIIKGIGILNAPKLYVIEPDLIEDVTHEHKKEVIGAEINSEDCFEFAPKIAPDGKTLYFVKECKDAADQDIWYSEIDSAGKWSEAKNIGLPLNNKGHNFVASISPDGNTLVIGNRYNEDGTDAGEGVSISTRTDDGKWGKPVTIDIPNYKNTNEHANFFMGPKGDVMLMALQDENSVGDLDLYVSLYNKVYRKWSEPQNLGLDINTLFSEDYPYLANDGKTLYFSSKGLIGYGGHDIFMSQRLDDTWGKWSKPENLGPFINTKSDDKGFVMASQGDHAYFNSAPFDADLHHMDIFRVDLPKMLHQIPRVLMSGTLYESEFKLPLRGTVTIKNEKDETIAFCASNPKSGKYVLSLEFGKTYKVQAEAFAHFKIDEKLTLIDTNARVELTKDFPFTSFLDSAKVLSFDNIFFEFKSANIREESYESMDKIAALMKQQLSAKFRIEGHTDAKGSREYNQVLSEQRAESIKNYLVSKGLNRLRFETKGYGKDKPIAENDTDEGRAKNRRVEFIVTEKDSTKKTSSVKKKN